MLNLPATQDDFRLACTKDLLDVFFPNSPNILHNAYVEGERAVFPIVAKTSEERQLLAAAELVRRAAKADLMHAPVLSASDYKTYLTYHFLSKSTEAIVALWLDKSHRVIAIDDISSGTVDTFDIHPRELVLLALQRNASALLLAHNCASGLPTPTLKDSNTSKKVKEALALVDVQFIDHVLIGGSNAFSLERFETL